MSPRQTIKCQKNFCLNPKSHNLFSKVTKAGEGKRKEELYIIGNTKVNKKLLVHWDHFRHEIFLHLQGVRKWNVFFENATVAKLLNILTRTDAF